MSVEANREAASRLIQSVGTGKIDLSALAEDAVWWTPALGDMTVPKFKEAFDGFVGALDGEGRMDVRATTAEGDRVALEVEGALPIKGKGLYANRYHFLIEFKASKIVKVKEYCDSAYLRDFFGH